MNAFWIRSSHFLSNSRINSHRTRLSVLLSASLSFPFRFPQINYSKGGPSEIIATKKTLQSVVCLAYRYAPESTLRKKKARKRGGDPRKKRKAKRKSKRSKKSIKVVFLVSTAKTGFFYSKRKSVESKDKLKLQKYDPVVNRHVSFQE